MGGYVLAECGQQSSKQRNRQRMPRDGVGKFRERRVRWPPARRDGVERLIVAIQRGQPFRG